MKHRLIFLLFAYILVAFANNSWASNSIVEFRLASHNKFPNSKSYEINHKMIYVESEVTLDRRHIKKAKLDIQSNDPPEWLNEIEKKGEVKLVHKPYIMIDIFLNEKGQKILWDVTSKNVGKILAMFIEGRLILAPKIIEPISMESISIGGDFVEQEATQIVDKINNNTE